MGHEGRGCCCRWLQRTGEVGALANVHGLVVLKDFLAELVLLGAARSVGRVGGT